MNGEPATQIRISGKDLGQMALGGFCPRCFWIKRHCKLPYQIFPGIFSSLDSYSKRLTWAYYAKHGKLPPWFLEQGLCGEPVKVPSTKTFNVLDEETNVLLTGVPDEVIKNDSGYIIVDYKTARYTGGQDELRPMYEVQLNAYAYIAERNGFGPVTALWLIYHEPHTEIDDCDEWCREQSFVLRFDNKHSELKIDPSMIPPLLRQLREIYNSPEPPPATNGCKDCDSIANITSRTYKTIN